MKKFFEKIKSLDTGTKVRTIIQFLSYINQAVALIGMSSYASSPVYQWISFGITLVITLIGYWYNNDWSKTAMLARDIFDMLADGKITQEEVQAFIEKNQPEIDIPVKSSEENKE